MMNASDGEYDWTDDWWEYWYGGDGAGSQVDFYVKDVSPSRTAVKTQRATGRRRAMTFKVGPAFDGPYDNVRLGHHIEWMKHAMRRLKVSELLDSNELLVEAVAKIKYKEWTP